MVGVGGPDKVADDNKRGHSNPDWATASQSELRRIGVNLKFYTHLIVLAHSSTHHHTQ